MSVRVLIADDQAVVRAGLRRIIDTDPEIEVVGEAPDGLAAIDAARRFAPHVALMDIRMPRLDGLAATRRLMDELPEPPRVLILTTFGLDEYVYEAMRAGAGGFLLKDAPPEDIVRAVHTIARGDALLDPGVTRAVIDRFADIPRLPPDVVERLADITPRERDVLVLIGRGLSNSEIAAELVVAEGTVKTHVGRLFAKLGLRDRVQAVIFAYEAGLLPATSRKRS